jgi:hypothetical protein
MTVPGLLREADATHRSQFCVGGVSVRLDGDYREDVALLPSLEPFRVETGLFDIHIRVERVSALSPASGQHRFDSGSTWELHESEAGFQFDFNAAIFGDRSFKRLLIDGRFRQATLQMNEECLAGYSHTVDPLGYPLDELLIMHRLTQEKAIEVHGAGIVTCDGEGNLFVGHSGAGKSTTTRLWTALEDVEVLSDDRIIVRRDEGRECKMRMYGTPWHGEAMYASPNSAPLARILILEHGYGNVLTPLSPSQAVAELFARSFVPFHRHEYVESALTLLQEGVEAVPVYRYAFEPDQRAVDAILNLRD